MPTEPDYGDDIDSSTFEQILEMDDDDLRDFSKTLFEEFKQQARQTLWNMKDAAGLPLEDPLDEAGTDDLSVEDPAENLSIEEKLSRLSRQGHFLKGSSATLGLHKVQKSCERIQHYGHMQDDAGEACNDSAEKQYQKIQKEMDLVVKNFHSARKRLDRFYE